MYIYIYTHIYIDAAVLDGDRPLVLLAVVLHGGVRHAHAACPYAIMIRV